MPDHDEMDEVNIVMPLTRAGAKKKQRSGTSISPDILIELMDEGVVAFRLPSTLRPAFEAKDYGEVIMMMCGMIARLAHRVKELEYWMDHHTHDA